MDKKLREELFAGEKPQSIKDVYLLTSKVTGFSIEHITFVIKNYYKNVHYYFIRPWLVTKGFIEMGGGFKFLFRDKETRYSAHRNIFHRFVINKKVKYERQTKNKVDNGRARKFFQEQQEWEDHPWGRFGYPKRVTSTENIEGEAGERGSIY